MQKNESQTFSEIDSNKENALDYDDYQAFKPRR